MYGRGIIEVSYKNWGPLFDSDYITLFAQDVSETPFAEIPVKPRWSPLPSKISFPPPKSF